MVRNMPSFTILSSDVYDPHEGSSNDDKNALNSETNDNIIIKKSTTKLLSIEDDADDNEPATEKSEGNNESLPIKPFSFSMGARPAGPPKKFFAARNKPSFKVSSFISSSPLLPSGSSSSSFYAGVTSYGGASSLQNRNVKRQRMSPVASNVPMKRANIKPKTMTSARGAVTSDTARKILGALERMSSPVRDASKLPNSPSSVLFNPLKRKTDQSFSLFANRPTTNLPPTSSLTASRNVNFQLREKTNSPFQFGTRDIRPSAPVKTFQSRGLPTSFSPDDNSKGSGKIKRQRQSSHYTAIKETDDEEPVNTLPEIIAPAPLVMSSLPKFSFGVSTVSKPQESKVSSVESKTTITDKQSFEGFKFSQPEVLSEGIKGTGKDVPKNSFLFSVPTVKETKIEKNNGPTAKKSQTIDLTKPKETFVQSNVTKPASEKSSSIWKKKSDGWECATCMLSNAIDATVCIACQSAKPGEKKATGLEQKTKLTFGNKFKAAQGSWECSECMLMNNPDSSVCKACNAKKPGKKEDKITEKSITIGQKPVGTKGFAAKFKVDEGMWECDTCMLQNKAKDNECISCKAKKPGAKESKEATKGGSLKFETPQNNSNDKGALLKAKFAASAGSWECESCMLQNNADVTACISCSTPKPGTSAEPKPVTISFGTAAINSNIKFGTGDSSSTISFGTNSGTNSGTGFAFGNSGSGGFNFGNSDKVVGTGINFGSSDSKGFVFGNNQASSGFEFGSSVGFTFGVPKEVKKSESSMTASTSKTEENNNMSDSKVVFTSSSQQTGISTTIDAKNATEKGGIKSIADAAKAGLLKVPEVDKKASDSPGSAFGTSAMNGPGSIDFSTPKSIKFGSNLEGGKTTESSVASADSVSFKFSTDSTDKANKSASGFSFAAPSSSLGQQSSANTGFNFGASGTFNFKPQSEQNASTEPNQTKETTQKQNSTISSEAPKFSFGSSSNTFNLKPAEQTTNQSTNQLKDPIVFENINTSTPVSAKFNFGQSPAQSTIESLFGNPQKKNENQMNVAKPFQFSVEPMKPTSTIFGQNSDSNSQMTEVNKVTNNAPTSNSLFNSVASKTDTNTNLFGGALSQNFSSPSSNMFGTPNALLGGKFSFGTNSNDVSNIFGSQQTQKEESQPTSGFKFSSTSVSTAGLFMDTVKPAADDKPKLFSFAAAPSDNQGSSPFSFGNPAVNSNAFGGGVSGGFSFGTNDNSAPKFSTGTGSPAPSNRVIKRAVRRKK